MNGNVKSIESKNILGRAVSTQLFWIITFSLFTAMAAQVAVPVQPVPFTLQTMLVLLSGAFLGARNGAISQILYVLMGVVGIPVFANFSLGMGVLFGPTGGYLLSFPLAAFIVGYIVKENSSFVTVVLAMLAGSLLILLFGSMYLGLFFMDSWREAFIAGAAVFSIWGVIKIGAAISIYLSFSKKYPRLPHK